MKTALITELKKVNPESIFGFYISKSLKEGAEEKLISELRDQLRDAPKELQAVIGAEAISLLKNVA
jgi:hypothetical protein